MDMEYRIKQCLHGFMVTGTIPHGMYADEFYAFSTLQEALNYLPKLFETQPTQSVNKE
jgi:hypothetical protein